MQMLSSIKQKLEQGEVVIGAAVCLQDATVSEALGFAGYDFLWIDAEHNGLDYTNILGHIIAASSGSTASFVRIRENDPNLVKPVLDMGADGIIFPMIKNSADAETAVMSCRYPPRGIRGVGPGRAVRYGVDDPMDYILSRGDDDIFKILQVEHLDCVNNLEAILEVEGIDLVMIGPSDLSISVGLLGQLEHPEVLGLIDRICERSTEAGIPIGAFTGSDPKTVKLFLDRGVRMIAVGADRGFLMGSAMNTLGDIRTLVES